MPDREEFKKLHPILNEMTQTFVELYQSRPDEKNRQKLIELESLLHEQLEKIQQAKAES